MSRCIQECDVLVIDRYNRCTDVLCDTTCLTVCNTCLSDGIKQRCLTMIYVTHYTDYRWTRNHLALILFILLEKLCNHINLLLFLTDEIELQCNLLSCCKINLRVNCYHLALHEKLLYYGRRLNLHLVS